MSASSRSRWAEGMRRRTRRGIRGEGERVENRRQSLTAKDRPRGSIDSLERVAPGKQEIAMQEFSDYLKWFPDTDYAVNAQFHIGNILFAKGDPAAALKAFEAVLANYPESSNKNADAMYMKGKTLVQLGDDKAAEAEYRAFLKKYPKHPQLTSKVQTELRAVATPQPRKRTR